MAKKPTPAELATATENGLKYDALVNQVVSTNTKLEKLPDGEEIINSGVTMAPSKRSGIVNVCEAASRACIMLCVLWFSGRRTGPKMRECAKNITALFAYWPERFYSRYDRELTNQEKRAADLGVRSYHRPNVASDLNHDRIVAKHPATRFYDYTAVYGRVLAYLNGELPANYSLTFSVKENTPYEFVRNVLRRGGNVAVVIDSYYWGSSRRYGLLPATITFTDGADEITVDCVDADRDDIRTPERDGSGKACCLRMKSQSKKLKETARRLGFAKPFAMGGKEHSTRYEMRMAGHCVIRLPSIRDGLHCVATETAAVGE